MMENSIFFYFASLFDFDINNDCLLYTDSIYDGIEKLKKYIIGVISLKL